MHALCGAEPAKAQSIEIDPVDHRSCLLQIGSTSGTQVSNICPALRLNVWYCFIGGGPFTENICRQSSETRGPWDGSPSWQLDYLDTTPGLGDFVNDGDPPRLFLAACRAEAGWYLRGDWDINGLPIYDCRRNTGADGDPPGAGGQDNHSSPSDGAFMQGQLGWAQVDTSLVQLSAEAVGFRCASGVSGSSGSLRLRLIAQQFPSSDGSYSGAYVLGELPLEPLVCNTQYANVSATVPWTSADYGNWAIMMTLEEYSASGWGVADYLNFSQGLSIEPPTQRFSGNVGYSITGNQLSLQVDRIDYACPFGVIGNALNLRVELYAFATPFTGVEAGWPIGHQDPGSLPCNYSFRDLHATSVALDVPADATFRTLFLLVQQGDGTWAYADYVNFATDVAPSSDYRLTVNVHGDGTVLIGSANIACTTSCIQTFPAGNAINLDASANGSNTFTGWTGACSGSTPRCTVTLNGDITVDATFASTSGGSPDARVSSLASHGSHTCASLADGHVICWGGNFAGQLGDGSYENRVIPVTVPGVLSATQVAAGALHSCALELTGQVVCWGNNAYGQLGDGSVTSSPYPRMVLGLGAVAIAAGDYHTCALGHQGEVWCWGENLAGELGIGFEGGSSQWPQLVTGLGPGSGVVKIAAGRGHTCAALLSGTVYCWGWNHVGQLGDSTLVNHSVPTAVTALDGAAITSLAAGQAHTCVATFTGSVFCWGWNGSGQIGDGTQIDRTTPVLINAANVANVAAGRAHTCAITTVGTTLCWGANDLGQSSLLPAPQILDPQNMLGGGITRSDSFIAAGSDHTCVSTFREDEILCWGNNDASQLGRVSASSTGAPDLVDRVNWNQVGIGGSWAFDDAQSQGILAQVFPDLQGNGAGFFFGGWFTYDPNGSQQQRWYTVQGPVYYGVAQQVLTIYSSIGGSFASTQPATLLPVGTATMQLRDCSHGTITASITDTGGTTYWQELRIHRLLSNTNCAPTANNGAVGHQLLSGAWAASTASSQGLVFDVNPIDNMVFGGWYTYLPNSSPGAGPSGQHWYSLQIAIDATRIEFDDIGIYDTTGGAFGQAGSPSTVQVGSGRLQFHSCSSAAFSYQFSSGLHAGQTGSFDLHPVGPMPAECGL
jgi:alpha-tubulin suppressor-like RCC1 family protein